MCVRAKPKENVKQPENSQQSYKSQQGVLNNSTRCRVNFPIKRHNGVVEKTNKIHLFVVCENTFHWQRHIRLKMDVSESLCQARESLKNNTGACIAYKVHFTPKLSGRM